MSDGAHVFDIVTTDKAGNQTTTPLAAVDIATQGPINGSPSESVSGITKTTSETISVTPTAENVPGNGVASVEIVDTSNNTTTAATIGAGGVYSATLTGLSDGAHVFDIVTTDKAGNQTTTALAAVDVATQAPVNSAPSESVHGLTRTTTETISATPTVEAVPGNGVASVEIVDTSNNKTTAATLGAGGVYSATLTGVSDGAHVFDIVTTDKAGNSTTTALTAVDIATQAPTVNASETVSGTTGLRTDVITATAAAEQVPGNAIASVVVYDGDTELGPASLSNGVWSYTASDLGLGAHDFSLLTTDAAGNATTTTLTPVDVIQPLTVSANESVSGLTNLTSDTLSETATAAPGLAIAGVEAFDGYTDLGAATFDAGTSLWSFTAQNLSDGAHDFSLVTTDSVGDTLQATLIPDLVATTPPSVMVSQILSGLTNNNQDTITETASAEAVGANAIKSVEVYDDGTAVGAATFSNGEWVFNTGVLADGAHRFLTVTTDAAGNVTSQSLPAIHVETTPPIVRATESVAGLTNQNVVTISETARVEAPSFNAIESVEVYDGATALGAATLSGGVWTFTTATLADGVHRLSTVTTDAAGNVTTDTLRPVRVATQAPAVTASENVSGLTDINQVMISETATAEAVNTNAIASVEVYDGATDLGAAALSGTVWTFTTPALADGAHNFRTVTTDAAGNTTTTTLAPIEIATAAPAVTLSQTLSGLTNQNQDTITEIASAEAVGANAIKSVEVYDDGAAVGAATFSGGEWVFDTGVLADGANRFLTVTTDTAGNVTSQSLPAIHVETTAPIVRATESAAGLTNQNVVTLSETARVEAPVLQCRRVRRGL